MRPGPFTAPTVTGLSYFLPYVTSFYPVYYDLSSITTYKVVFPAIAVKSLLIFVIIASEVIRLIKIRLSELMGRKRYTQKYMCEQTGIRPGTINLLYHEASKQIRLDHLSAICRVLECSPGDLLEYVPDKKT